jgi:hypothetical protein
VWHHVRRFCTEEQLDILRRQEYTLYQVKTATPSRLSLYDEGTPASR